MLLHCLNPSCKTPFHHLNEGRVFSIERIISTGGEPCYRIEHFWLCGPCSLTLKVVVEDGQVTTQPIHPEPIPCEPERHSAALHRS